MQFLAAIANDSDYMPAFFHELGRATSSPAVGRQGEVWGLGYYAEERALLIRKPAEILGERSFYDLAADVRSQVVLAIVKAGVQQTQLAPPHRFRQWMFAAMGDLDSIEQLRPRVEDRLPDFIRTEVGGIGPEDLAFAMFLREQHERGFLPEPLVGGSVLAEALQRSTETIANLAVEEGIEPPKTTYVATNGRVILVSRHGPAVHWRLHEGLETLPDGPPDPAMNDFKQIVAALKRFRGVAFAGHLDEHARDWSEVEVGQTLWVDRQLEVS